MIDEEIRDFGIRLGLDGLELNESGLATLALDGYSLTLETGEGGCQNRLVMTLGLPLEPASAAAHYREALERSSWENALSFPLSAALFRDNLLLSVATALEDVTSAHLENILRFLLDEAERYR